MTKSFSKKLASDSGSGQPMLAKEAVVNLLSGHFVAYTRSVYFALSFSTLLVSAPAHARDVDIRITVLEQEVRELRMLVEDLIDEIRYKPPDNEMFDDPQIDQPDLPAIDVAARADAQWHLLPQGFNKNKVMPDTRAAKPNSSKAQPTTITPRLLQNLRPSKLRN